MEVSAEKTTSRSDGQQTPAAPSISLPKGGGAIRGIGEKFAANPVTGTGSLSVPIATSPGRSGFGPQLSLSYDSGAGNGPFGFGWSLSLPAITRKTDKGLPQYRDAEESDVFILSGAEDLVPVLGRDGRRVGARGSAAAHGARRAVPRPPLPPAHRGAVRPHRALDERRRPGRRPLALDLPRQRHHAGTARTAKSRIADPADPRRIFSWLICESYDDKGNVDRLRLQAGGRRASVDLRAQAHERNRDRRARPTATSSASATATATPYFPRSTPAADWPALPADDRWMFEVVFDYGEHDAGAPDAAGRRRRVARAAPTRSPPTAPASRSAPTASASAC